MDGSSVILVSFFTAAATAAGTVYVMDRYNLLPPKAPLVVEAIVPQLEGVLESDARANAAAAHVALLVASREPSPDKKTGTVLRQSVAAGQHVPREHPVSVV